MVDVRSTLSRPDDHPPGGQHNPCRCCHDLGWTPADHPTFCGTGHPWTDTLTFAGLTMTECPHHHPDTDDAHPDPHATPEGSQAIVDALLDSGLTARHYDPLGIHHGELRRHIVLDHMGVPPC